MDLKDTRKTLALSTYDDYDVLLAGLRLGNALWHAVNAPPLAEETVPTPSRNPFVRHPHPKENAQ